MNIFEKVEPCLNKKGLPSVLTIIIFLTSPSSGQAATDSLVVTPGSLPATQGQRSAVRCRCRFDSPRAVAVLLGTGG